MSQKEEEDARKLYDEFVESFGDEPEQKASKRSFTRGGVIQPGTSASSAGTFSLVPSCSCASHVSNQQHMHEHACIHALSFLGLHQFKASAVRGCL